MSQEEPRRTVTRVRAEDLDPWQQDLLAESRRISREEQAYAEQGRREAAETGFGVQRPTHSPDDRA